MVLEKMDADLSRWIDNKDGHMSGYQIQCIMYQIMRGLLCLRTARIIHRDLKPGNILFTASGAVKIGDLGLARSIDTECDDTLTEYVVTRYYRAPEIVLTATHYTYSVDIWSAGCILGEMLLQKPLFKGKDSLDQVRTILTVIGSPALQDISWIPKLGPARAYVERCITPSGGETFDKLFSGPTVNPDARDLLSRMLRFDPSKRISVDNALVHTYLENFRSDTDPEVAAARAVQPIDWSFDRDLCFDGRGRPRPFDEAAFRAAFIEARMLIDTGGSTAKTPRTSTTPRNHTPRNEDKSSHTPRSEAKSNNTPRSGKSGRTRNRRSGHDHQGHVRRPEQAYSGI